MTVGTRVIRNALFFLSFASLVCSQYYPSAGSPPSQASVPPAVAPTTAGVIPLASTTAIPLSLSSSATAGFQPNPSHSPINNPSLPTSLNETRPSQPNSNLNSSSTTTTTAKGPLTGDTQCNGFYCMSITLNKDAGTAEFLITTLASFQPGWLAFGIGSSMTTADLVIVWPNPDGTATVSRRQTKSYVMPQPLANQSAITQLPIGTKTPGADGSFTAHFIRPLVLAESTLDPTSSSARFIWAVSSDNPSASGFDSTITIHKAKSSWAFDLSKPIANGSIAGPPSSSTPQLSTYDYLIYAHGSIMFLAWAVSMPTAIVFAVFFRHLANWVRIHWSIQVFSTAVLAAVGYGLGNVAHGDRPDNIHTRLGTALCIALLVQIFLGWLIHHLYDPNRTHRPIRNWAHRIFGLILLLTSFVQIPLGIIAYTSDHIPLYAFGGYIALLLVIFIAFGFRAANVTKKVKYGQVNPESRRLASIQGEERVWATDGDDEEYESHGRARF